jgi:glutathione S-transferase
MLTLYHHGSSVCAAKVRMALEEKSLPWDGVYIDILKGDQFTPDYMKLNPKAVVPTLVHDGAVIRDSNVIVEYLEDVFPETPLRPADPAETAEARLWAKGVDEELHPACAALTFMASHRHTIQRLGPEGVKAFLDSTPEFSVTADWHEKKKMFVRDGFAAPGGAEKVRFYDAYLTKMEDALADHAWLAGESFSFADVAIAPYVTRLDMLSMDGLWKNGRRPRVEDWFERVKARPSYQPAFYDWIPEQLENDLRTNGAKSWPEVAAIVGL